MAWAATLATAGLGAWGGYQDRKAATKRRETTQEFIRKQEGADSAYVANQRRLLGAGYRTTNRAFKRSKRRSLRSGTEAKRTAVQRERQMMGEAAQQEAETGLVNSVFQSSRRGITAETSAVLASIDESTRNQMDVLDMGQAQNRAGFIQGAADLEAQRYGLESDRISDWLQSFTGARLGETPQAVQTDTSAFGSIAEAIFKGTGTGDSLLGSAGITFDSGQGLLSWLMG